jgi:hypothetical protein
MFSLMAALMMTVALAMFGCGGGGGFENAAPAELENMAFTFADGSAIGLPGQAVTLAFGDFAGTNTGPFTLQADGGTATGTVTVSSCLFDVLTSTIEALPVGTQINTDCELSGDDELRITNLDTGESSTSNPGEVTGTEGG